jgi:hypothetical protein
VDDVACYRVEVLVVPVALGHHPRGDAGIALDYLVKTNHLHRLTLCGDQLLLDSYKGDKKMLQLKT